MCTDRGIGDHAVHRARPNFVGIAILGQAKHEDLIQARTVAQHTLNGIIRVGDKWPCAKSHIGDGDHFALARAGFENQLVTGLRAHLARIDAVANGGACRV